MPQETSLSKDGARLAVVRRAIGLEWFTVLYNVAEGVFSIWAGLMAGSIALVGFGMDSFIEVLSGSALLWRLHYSLRREDAAIIEKEHEAERLALRIVGVSFFLLALYVTARSSWMLWRREAPEESLLGIVIGTLSLVFMVWLGLAKRRAALALGSRALLADSMETFVCTYLSAALLLGLGAHMLWGWWWADPAAALLMLPLVLKEGWEAWRESGE